MPAPASYDEVLAARYGTDRSPWPRRVVVAALVTAFAAATGWAALSVVRPRIEGNVLSWQASDRSVAVVLEVRGTSTAPVTCVVRAQDGSATDIGYRHFAVPTAPATASVDLPTLFRASSVSVLGCAPEGEALRVAPPDFPPGVAIP